jgi:hypothetical protein
MIAVQLKRFVALPSLRRGEKRCFQSSLERWSKPIAEFLIKPEKVPFRFLLESTDSLNRPVTKPAPLAERGCFPRFGTSDMKKGTSGEN